jgi:hypothetical protein
MDQMNEKTAPIFSDSRRNKKIDKMMDVCEARQLKWLVLHFFSVKLSRAANCRALR